MIKSSKFKLFCTLLAFALLPAPAMAGIDGLYVRNNNGHKSILRVFNCGGGKGIKVEKSSHKPSVGKVIMCGAKKGKNGWSGQILNLEDKKRYDATISNTGSKLKIRGCALGGMVCRNHILSRAK